MFEHSITIRVRYGETDKMGYVYYGNYLEYLEVARVETLRALGISYANLENNNVMLPVRHCEVNYQRPIIYDEEIIIKTNIVEFHRTRIVFEYEMINLEHIQVATASTTLIFINALTRRPCRPPEVMQKLLAPYLCSN